MRVALDSNFMIYAEGLADDPRNDVAQQLLKDINPSCIIVPLQSVAETTRWLIKRAKQPLDFASKSAVRWATTYVVQSTDINVMLSAMQLLTQHRLQAFDCIIFASAAEAGADILLSEDMQHGFTWRGVTIINPFLSEPSPLLQKLIKK